MIIDKLQEFRQRVYGFLGNGRDAIFDLMDAVLTSPSVKSFAELSLSAVYRRKWSSLYESLKDSRPRRGRLRRLCVEQIPKDIRPLLAGDHTGWGRPHAKTLKERSFVHQPNLVEGNKPIVLGHDYSNLGWVPEKSGSWAIPLCHERISSFETAAQRGAFQLRQVCRDLSVRPIATYDSEYGSAAFINLTEDIPADLLLRLRPNRCLYKAPEAYRGCGRPRKHGDKFQLANADSWGEAQSTFTLEDETVGQVQIQQWSNLHFKKAAQRHFQVIRVTHPHCSGLWLAWVGENMPTLPQLWRLYLRRFAIDHWNRFAKQRLHWTLPHLLTPQQALRWSDLMPLLSWQLWLARQLVIDSPLPWQKPQTNLSLGRVAQGFATLLVRIGSPACSPKPRGKSLGWKSGRKRAPFPRFPIIKKRASRPKKVNKDILNS